MGGITFCGKHPDSGEQSRAPLLTDNQICEMTDIPSAEILSFGRNSVLIMPFFDLMIMWLHVDCTLLGTTDFEQVSRIYLFLNNIMKSLIW